MTNTLRNPNIRYNWGFNDGMQFKHRESTAPEGIKLVLAGKHFDKDYQRGVQAAFWG